MAPAGPISHAPRAESQILAFPEPPALLPIKLHADARLAVYHAEDEQAQERLEQAWSALSVGLNAGQPPPQGERGLLRRHDRDGRDPANRWNKARYRLDGARRAEPLAREALLTEAGGAAGPGAGLEVARYWQGGAVDWPRLRQELDPPWDLDAERKPGAGR